MHPATPLIPAIWSSSKHAGDVKNPSPRCRRTTGPWIKMEGVRRRKRGLKDGGGWQGGGSGMREVVMLRGGSSMCHPHILAALLLIHFSRDHWRSQYIKHEGLGGGGVSAHLHPCCHLTQLYLLCANANSFINLFTSPLVATALCFWWRTANDASFSDLGLTALGGVGDFTSTPSPQISQSGR